MDSELLLKFMVISQTTFRHCRVRFYFFFFRTTFVETAVWLSYNDILGLTTKVKKVTKVDAYRNCRLRLCVVNDMYFPITKETLVVRVFDDFRSCDTDTILLAAILLACSCSSSETKLSVRKTPTDLPHKNAYK